MNETRLIIGNGFDLACKLRTKYRDFLNSKSLTDCLTNWYNAIVIKDTALFEYQSQIINILGYNVCDIYFFLKSKRKANEIYWCDIEAAMLDGFHVYNDQESIQQKRDEENISWRQICNTLIQKEGPFERNTQFENDIIQFLVQSKKQFKSENDFYSFLLASLSNFEKRFGEYVELEKRTTLTYLSNSNTLLSRLKSENEKITEIDSFNYTDPFTQQHDFAFHNINGITNSPILGIDTAYIENGEMKIINPQNEEFQFTKTSRRLIGKINNPSEENQIIFSDLIIYGHSLNKQDYSYFFPLFDYLRLTDASSNGKLIFSYSLIDGESQESTVKNLKTAISIIISSYEDYYYNHDRIEKRLLDSLSAENRLEIRKIKIDDLSFKKSRYIK